MSASQSETSRRPQILWGTAIAVTLLVLFLAFLRRDSRPQTPAADPGAEAANADAELQRQLKATLTGLRPENLHVSVGLQGVVGDLNLWWGDYAARTPPEEAGPRAALVQEWLGEAAAAHVAAGRFSGRDAAHVRNAQMFRAIAASLSAGGGTPRELATSAFRLVVQQMALIPGVAAPTPLGAFETLLAGRGTANDRTWVLAEILRQLSIDCVVLEPRTPPAENALPARLVGAIIPEEGVVLFDPQLGLPLPPTTDSAGALPTSAVTLQEARNDAAILRQFDVPDGPAYPWTAAMLADLKVHFIVDSAYASPRMLSLQTQLPSEFVATLYDGPAVSAESPSLADRIVAAGADGGWSPDAVSAWNYPEQQLTAFYAAGGEESTAADQALGNLRGPNVLEERVVDGQRQLVPAPSRRPLRVVRVQHLRGELEAALQAYGEIRDAPLAAGNAAVREDAVHWVAVCQEELGRYETAVSTLKLWLKNYPLGVWSAATKEALARCAALRGNFELAIQSAPPASDRPNLGMAYLVRRWQAQMAVPATPESGPTP